MANVDGDLKDFNVNNSNVVMPSLCIASALVICSFIEPKLQFRQPKTLVLIS